MSYYTGYNRCSCNDLDCENYGCVCIGALISIGLTILYIILMVFSYQEWDNIDRIVDFIEEKSNETLYCIYENNRGGECDMIENLNTLYFLKSIPILAGVHIIVFIFVVILFKQFQETNLTKVTIISSFLVIIFTICDAVSLGICVEYREITQIYYLSDPTQQNGFKDEFSNTFGVSVYLFVLMGLIFLIGLCIVCNHCNQLKADYYKSEVHNISHNRTPYPPHIATPCYTGGYYNNHTTYPSYNNPVGGYYNNHVGGYYNNSTNYPYPSRSNSFAISIDSATDEDTGNNAHVYNDNHYEGDLYSGCKPVEHENEYTI